MDDQDDRRRGPLAPSRPGRSRWPTGRARASGTAAVLLTIALAAGCGSAPVSLDMGAGGSTEAAVGTTPGSVLGTTVPGTALAGTTLPGTTVSGTQPGTFVPTTSTTTTTPAVSKEITSDGVLGVFIGMPMDEAVAQVTAQLGPPDEDRDEETRCTRAPARHVAWGPLILVKGPAPSDDRLRGLMYQTSKDGTEGVSKIGLLLGGVPLDGVARPLADVEASVRSAVVGLSDSGYPTKDVYRASNADRRVDAYLGGGPTLTSILGVIVWDRADPISC